jgi:hypothetical protein
MICVPGPQHRPPVVARVFLEQQQFKLPAGARVGSAQSGRNHARIVEHQHVARAEIPRQIAELPVRRAAAGARQNEQARLIALRRGMLRNQLQRQIKIEIGGPHAASFQHRISIASRRMISFLSGILSPTFECE